VSRTRRILRRVGIGLLVLVVAVTVASFAYNVATSGRERGARSLYAGPYVVVDGVSLAYRRWGRTGSPIVLVGGFVEPSWVWHRVGPLLARRHRVVAVDLPPFGYSQRRGPYTLERWVELVRDFGRALGLRRPVLVGHSLGAAVAVESALRDPRGVAGIVLLDGDALPIGGPPRFVAKLLLDPYYTSVFRVATGSDWIVGRGLRGAYDSSRPKPTRAEIAVWKRPFRVRGTAAAFRELLRDGGHGVSLAAVRNVRVPAAVVWGAGDTVDDVASGRATAAALHTRLVLLPRAGHLSMLDDPRGVAAAIERRAVRGLHPG
jgi:pimeloyl-ACP methyl ester carboxylesterase